MVLAVTRLTYLPTNFFGQTLSDDGGNTTVSNDVPTFPVFSFCAVQIVHAAIFN